LRIGTGNPSTGFIDITLTAPTQIIEIEFGALSTVGSLFEYVQIDLNGNFFDLNQGNVSFFATTSITPYLTNNANPGLSGVIGVIEPTGSADCGTIVINFECSIPEGTVLRISNIANGAMAGAYYKINICNDLPTVGANCVECPAGVESPIFNGVAIMPTLTNICPNELTDLTSLESQITNLPSQAVLTWHSNILTSTTNLLNNANAVNDGIYYTAFYNDEFNCFSENSTPVTVINTTCICDLSIPNLDCDNDGIVNGVDCYPKDSLQIFSKINACSNITPLYFQFK